MGVGPKRLRNVFLGVKMPTSGSPILICSFCPQETLFANIILNLSLSKFRFSVDDRTSSRSLYPVPSRFEVRTVFCGFALL